MEEYEVPRAQRHRRQRPGGRGPGGLDVLPVAESDQNVGEGNMAEREAQQHKVRQRSRVHLKGLPGVVPWQRHTDTVHPTGEADPEQLHRALQRKLPQGGAGRIHLPHHR